MGCPDNLRTWNLDGTMVFQVSVLRSLRQGCMLNDGVTDAVELIVRTKAKVVILSISAVINPLALQSVKWSFFPIVSHQVLPDFRADLDQEIAKVADDREVP